ncbi:MAG: ATPase domain-containing protein [Candidatus Diapherotrites archaeon]
MPNSDDKYSLGKIFRNLGQATGTKEKSEQKEQILEEVKPEDLIKKGSEAVQPKRRYDNVVSGQNAQRFAEIDLTTQKPKDVIERVPTGIEGLDELIEGGFEKGSVVLLAGAPGTGKTIFALQFLYHGITALNEPGIYITFEEGKETLLRHALVFGWDFKKLESQNLFRVLEYKPHQVEKLMKEGGGPIKDTINEIKAKRLVVDSITSYALLFHDEYVKRQSILEFFDLLHNWGTTNIIISEAPVDTHLTKSDSPGFLSDAIIALYYTKSSEKSARIHCCEILKMRGTRHTNRILAFGFEEKGIKVYPDVEVF